VIVDRRFESPLREEAPDAEPDAERDAEPDGDGAPIGAASPELRSASVFALSSPTSQADALGDLERAIEDFIHRHSGRARLVAGPRRAGDRGPAQAIDIERAHLVPLLAEARVSLGLVSISDIFGEDHANGATNRDAPVPRRFTVSYRFRSRDGFVVEVSTPVPSDDVLVPSIAELWPEASCAEREFADLFGIEVDGAPDARRFLLPEDFPGYPLRKDYRPSDPARLSEARRADAMRATVDRAARSDRPSARRLRPLVLEAGHPDNHGLARLSLEFGGADGDAIETLDAEIGFHHRGVEKAAESLPWERLHSVARGFSPPVATTIALAVSVAVETLLEIEVPPRASRMRVVMLETARIGAHALALARVAAARGSAEPRRRALSIYRDAAELCRYSVPAPGGLDREAPDGQERRIAAWALDVRESAPSLIDELRRAIGRRALGLARISESTIDRFDAGGIIARAAGVDRDLRRDAPAGGWEAVEFDLTIAQAKDGDAASRIAVIGQEIAESARVARAIAIDAAPEGEIRAEPRTWLPRVARLAAGDAGEATIEGATGPSLSRVVCGEGGQPGRIRLKPAGLVGISLLESALAGVRLDELGLAIASLGLIEGEADR
jgi:NADH:ubiquinone oxidoreductase subunit D/NADH:ubiquinone oxidoreductase subunit C